MSKMFIKRSGAPPRPPPKSKGWHEPTDGRDRDHHRHGHRLRHSRLAPPQSLLLRWCQAIASGHTDRRRIAVIRSLFMPYLQLATLWNASSILRHRPDLLQISRGAGEGRCDLMKSHRNAVKDRKRAV